jgi:putative alpha-1,2-mannosidase
MDDYNKYRERASNWENLWNPDISSMGAKGFIWPRNAEGNWTDSLYERLGVDLKAPMGPVKFDPLTFGIGGFTSFLYESHSWEYSFYVPQDIKKLIEKCGGNNFFVARLDTFFLKGLFNVGNEFGFLTPYLYIWAGRPDKTAYQVNYIRRRYFNSSRRGLPGNDDSGAMSSLYVFDALGLFPVAGQDFYLITGPLFGKTEIRLENGNSFKIIAQNLNKTNIYIQSARLNGKALNRAWLRHQDLVMGGSLELVMGPEPSGWGRSEVPPSLSDNN